MHVRYILWAMIDPVLALKWLNQPLSQCGSASLQFTMIKVMYISHGILKEKLSGALRGAPYQHNDAETIYTTVISYG